MLGVRPANRARPGSPALLALRSRITDAQWRRGRGHTCKAWPWVSLAMLGIDAPVAVPLTRQGANVVTQRG